MLGHAGRYAGDEARHGEDAADDSAQLQEEVAQRTAAARDLDRDGRDVVLEVDRRGLALGRRHVVEVVRELVRVLRPAVRAASRASEVPGQLPCVVCRVCCVVNVQLKDGGDDLDVVLVGHAHAVLPLAVGLGDAVERTEEAHHVVVCVLVLGLRVQLGHHVGVPVAPRRNRHARRIENWAPNTTG